MSVILKGVDLPKEGEEITLAIFHDGDIVSYKHWLPKEAKAIQIPKDHGRLIEERYPGELKAKYPEGLFIIYHSADEDPERFVVEAEAER